MKLHTPRDGALSAGICCFEVEGHKPDDIVKQLLARKIIARSKHGTVLAGAQKSVADLRIAPESPPPEVQS